MPAQVMQAGEQGVAALPCACITREPAQLSIVRRHATRDHDACPHASPAAECVPPPAATRTCALASTPQAASANSSTASFASHAARRRCVATAAPAAAVSAAACGSVPSIGSNRTKPSVPSPRAARTTPCSVLHCRGAACCCRRCCCGLLPSLAGAAGLLKLKRCSCRPASAAAAAAPASGSAAAPVCSCCRRWKSATHASTAPDCLQRWDCRAAGRGLAGAEPPELRRRCASVKQARGSSAVHRSRQRPAPDGGQRAANQQRLFIQVAPLARQGQQHECRHAQGEQRPGHRPCVPQRRCRDAGRQALGGHGGPGLDATACGERQRPAVGRERRAERRRRAAAAANRWG